MKLLNTLPGLLLLTATAALAQNDPAEVRGTWHMTASTEAQGEAQGEGGGSSRIATLRLELVDGKLAGTWISGRATYAIQDPVYADRKLSFSFEFDTGGAGKRHMVYTGMVEGNKIVGELTTPRSTKEVDGKRVVEKPAAAPAPGS